MIVMTLVIIPRDPLCKSIGHPGGVAQMSLRAHRHQPRASEFTGSNTIKRSWRQGEGVDNMLFRKQTGRSLAADWTTYLELAARVRAPLEGSG